MNDILDSHADDKVAPSSNEAVITLGMLAAIETNASHSQRSLAGELGIALGLANAYLKRCVRKGWVKVQQVPANRYAYYLTPQGFTEKARLTGDYLSASLGFFRRARQQASELFEAARRQGQTRFALVGSSELAEIVAMGALESDVTLVGILDARRAGGRLAGLPILSDPLQLPAFDAAIITDVSDPYGAYAKAVAAFGPSRVLVLDLLKINTAARYPDETS